MERLKTVRWPCRPVLTKKKFHGIIPKREKTGQVICQALQEYRRNQPQPMEFSQDPWEYGDYSPYVKLLNPTNWPQPSINLDKWQLDPRPKMQHVGSTSSNQQVDLNLQIGPSITLVNQYSNSNDTKLNINLNHEPFRK